MFGAHKNFEPINFFLPNFPFNDPSNFVKNETAESTVNFYKKKFFASTARCSSVESIAVSLFTNRETAMLTSLVFLLGLPT